MILPVERTLAALTLRQILARRRALGLFALGLLPILLALVPPGPGREVAALLDIHLNLVIPVLLPLAALVVGTGAFGAEVEDGTILYVLAKPVARWRIVLVRVAVAAAATVAMIAPGALATGLLLARDADPGRVVVAFPIATAAGALVYSVLFVALSLSTRRALVAGLCYVVLWEGIVARRFSGTRLLSVREFILTTADRLSTTNPRDFDAALTPGTALVMATVVCLGAAWLAVSRLQRFEVGEAG